MRAGTAGAGKEAHIVCYLVVRLEAERERSEGRPRRPQIHAVAAEAQTHAKRGAREAGHREKTCGIEGEGIDTSGRIIGFSIEAVRQRQCRATRIDLQWGGDGRMGIALSVLDCVQKGPLHARSPGPQVIFSPARDASVDAEL